MSKLNRLLAPRGWIEYIKFECGYEQRNFTISTVKLSVRPVNVFGFCPIGILISENLLYRGALLR